MCTLKYPIVFIYSHIPSKDGCHETAVLESIHTKTILNQPS